MTCARCVHFSAKAASDATIEPVRQDLGHVGVCRRYPPQMTKRGDAFLTSIFPNVHRENACGEYQDRIPLC
jgi:hypothetical protein